MKLILLIGISIFQFSFSQNTSLYFKFDSGSKATFQKEDGSGNLVQELLYTMNFKENGDALFFIKDKMFIYEKSKMQKRVLNIEETKDISVLGPDKVVQHVEKIQQEYPFGHSYPSKEHPKMYIVEQSNKGKFILYEVNWTHYNE